MKTGKPGPSGETNETPQHRALGTASRAAILRLVRDSDDSLTAAEVVARIGLHASTVRAHLEQLVDAGLLMKARASDGAPGRPAWRYRAAAPEPAPGPYRTLAKALLDHLAIAGGKAAHEAGEAWGEQLASTTTESGGPVEAALEVLQGLGFAPRRQPASDGDPTGSREAQVHLYTCPFLDLVGEQPDVMCALHAGMIRGVVRAAGAPQARAGLEPFAAPNACVVRLHLSPTRGKRAPS